VTLQYAGPDGLIGTPDDPAPVTVFTDANGNYTFPNLVPGVYQITETNLPGYISVADTDGGNPDVIGVTVAANQAIADRDFEDKLPAQVSGTVFDDLNLNGQQDPGEAGISGVTVTLKQGATTIATTTTNGLGEYEFTGLAAGSNYTIVETQPAGWISTKDADLGDPDQIGPFSLASGQNLTDRDFGEAKYGSISGRVCVDANNNGQCEAGETGISGVQVCAAAGLCGTTDGTGNYTIPNVPPGNYTVTESQPAGYTSSSPDTLPVTVPSGQAVPNVNYAEVTPVNNTFSISGTVCANVNGDGVCDPGEVPLPGVTVQLYDRQGALVATTTTNAAGDYTFPNVPKGDYTVAELDLPNYFSVNDAVSPNDNAIPVTVNNANVTDRDFVDAPAPGKLSGMVFEDLNLNGQRDAGEPGISNVTVSLNTGATAITNANGYYEFVSLPPATYTITESDPSGYISTGDVDGANDNKIVATVPAGGSVTDRDFGDAKLGSINGTVWNDVDKDGIQDPGEAGLPNVVVCATPTAGGAPVCDVTDGNGNYNLPNLPPGSYVVTETDPAGYTSTTPNSVPVNLGSGQNTDSPDFGDVLNDPTLGSIAGTVCKNVNSNGVCGDVAGETGLPGVTVQLYQGNTLIRTTTTDALGNYLFDNLPAANDYNVREVNPTGYTSVTDADGNTNGADKIDPVAVNGNSVVDRDFIDTPTPSAISGKVCDDTNRNGVCDAGEPGIGGVTVTLYDSNGNPTTKTTAGDGTYSFPNLPPDTYTIVETDKPGYQSTGDVYGLNDNTIVVPLAPGSTVANQNFADAPIPGGISGTVYNDLNGDGNFDPGEPGLVGVKVCLTPPGDPAGCTTTDAQGRYSFSNLTPGNYTVTETDPSGYTSTGDADGNGNTFNVIAVIVPSGVTVTEQNFFDYARQALPSVSVIKTLKDTPASVRIGQKVTYNIAIQNTGNVAITVLPLVDTYNTTFLTYGYPPALYATPASNDNVNDGTINWTDLTVSFGQDLAPGQTWNVEVVFTAREDTSTIPNTGKTDNTAIIQGALAGNDQVPTQSSTVPIEILRTTGVQVTGFAAAVSQGVIQISWDTADETRILGFNLYRVGERGTIEPVNGDLIFAQHAGQGAGDHYSILDTLQPGAVYRLEVVRLDGSAVVFGDTKVVAP
jgi:hypothetical protein